MIHPVCREVIHSLKIRTFVETGTFVGETVAGVCEWFAGECRDFGVIVRKVESPELAPFFPKRKVLYPVFEGSSAGSPCKIHSVDVDGEKQKTLAALFKGNPNVRFHTRSSQEFLANAENDGLFKQNQDCFFYLDAHWGAQWPLREELQVILTRKRAVVAIDDFAVPGHPLHGFDAYKTTICGWYYIRDLFRQRADHRICYPKQPNKDGRGSVLIFLGYSPEELRFLDTLPVFTPRVFKGAPFTTAAARTALFLLTITGLYGLFVKLYLRIKWGSARAAPGISGKGEV